MDVNTLRDAWLLEEAASFQGWDFSRLEGRRIEEALPWEYRDIVKRYLRPEHKLLDIGTGGGEVLLSLGHTNANTYVTESYPPNAELCCEKLAPLGITVWQVDVEDKLSCEDEMFDVVLNRHAVIDIDEVYRVLKPGGVFITQQVGDNNGNRIMPDFLVGKYVRHYGIHSLESHKTIFENAGFGVVESGEHHYKVKFVDIGAVVYYAKIIEWEYAGFSVETHFDRLLKLQEKLDVHGFVEDSSHRFYLVGRK